MMKWCHEFLGGTVVLKRFKWDVLDHPPYSLDLVASHFHLKKHLGEIWLDDDEEVKEEVMAWFKR